MALEAVHPNPPISQRPESGTDSDTTADVVTEAWKAQCKALGLKEEEVNLFESHACHNLAAYLERLELACQNHQRARLNIMEWFEPIFKAVELFTPAAAVAVQAYPNPGSLVLGGIVGILQITSRLINFQKLTLQMLARMGRKAQVLLEYETNVYKYDASVQKALVRVYGDIIAFCLKAFQILDGKELRARVKGVGLILFRDFESRLGTEAHNFESHLEDLQDRALMSDRRRLKEVHERQEAHHQKAGEAFDQAREQFQRNNELLENMFKRERDLREQKDQRQKEKEKARLLQWLSPLSFQASYDRRCDEHLEGTGSWFLQSETYENWKSSAESDLLWVKGRPGCGKSVLSAVTVNDVKLDVDVDMAYAYAFCRREDESSQSPYTILGALSKQLCQQQIGIDSVLESQYKGSGESPSDRMIRDVLDSVLSSLTKVFLVIDALDELKNNNELVQSLVKLMQERSTPCIKVIVFSRHDYALEQCLGRYTQLQLDYGANVNDVEAYIESLFPDDPQATSNREIREECVKKADGMFLWVKLLAQSLQGPMTPRMKLRKIRETPTGLGAVYNQMLGDVWSQDEDIRATAFLVLIWVTHARTPLTGSQMLEAVADHSESRRVAEVSKFPHAEDLVAICKNLVFIDKDGYFRLCHESVRGYLDTHSQEAVQPLIKYQEGKLDAQASLTEICVTYLLLEDFNCGPSKSLARLETVKRRYPFFSYAAKFWGYHASQQTASQLQDHILELVSSTPRRGLSLQAVLCDLTEEIERWEAVKSSNPLHIISVFGLLQTAEVLQHAESMAAETDASGATPLSNALLGKHHGMSLWLLERLRNPQGELLLSAREKISAIHLAAGLGWADVLKLLLAADQAFVDAKLDPDGPTPLVTACRAGEGENAAAVATVSVLIESMADVNLLDGKGDSPLILSTLLSHAALVEVLLRHDADPNCRDAYGWTSLHYAAQAQNTIIAEALLARGADPLARISNANQYAPLHVAAQKQAVNIIRLLYRANPGLDLKTSAGFTALHIAAILNWGPTVQTLLELGAPKDAVDNDGRTALFLAAEEGARDALKWLIDARCDVRVVTTDGRTVLHGAASSGKASIVRYIMRNLTIEDSNMLLSKRSGYGETVMHAAVRGGSAKVAGILLEAGANATVGDAISSSPLHYAASFGHKALSYQILQQTRDANPRTEGGNTPLHLAAQAGKLEFMQQFFEDCSRLALQIDVNAENVSKQTPFMLALVQGREDAARFLLERTSVSKPDSRGNYPIHFAAFYGFDSIVTALLTHDGASSKDSLGRTTLSNAAITGQTRTVKLLATSSPELLHIRNQAESTPVLDAIMYNNLDCAHYLLDSGAEYEVMDEQGNSLLHAAAWSGDMLMVQRLLNAGCRVDVANRFGETVLHKAVDANSVEIVDALIAAGLSDVDVQTHRGDSSVMIAAERGNLTMMLKLGSYGADYGIRNHLGRTAAHAAADCGNVAILTFLRSRGEDLRLSDNEGFTPILMAASAGYPETVKFLLQSPGSAVNRLSKWHRESPLTLAAKGRYPLTIRHLLAAGGDPQHREASGYSALDYASLHPASLREFHTTQHVTDSGTIEEQRRTVYHTIRRCCEALLLVSEEPDIRELYLRLMALDMLSDALHLVQDYGAAITCYKELYWPPERALLRVDYTCHICGVQQFTESVYVCKSCYPKINLCAACHADYESFGRRAPKAFLELLELERLVRPVRIASEGLPIIRVVGAVVRIEAATSWLSTARDQYDGWEQKYNSSRRYEELQRPGQEFVKLVKEVEELAIKVGNKHVAEPEDREALASCNKIYQDHQRKHSPDKEISEFLCKSHEYVVVSASKLAQSENSNLDPISGRITRSFLRELQIAYTQDSGTQIGALDEKNTRVPLELSKTTGTKSDTESSHLHEVVGTSEKKLDEDPAGLEGRPSLSKPERPQRVDKLTLVPAVERTTVGSVHSPTGGRARSLKRAFSLPTPMTEDSVWKDDAYTTDTDHAEVLAAVQTCLDSDNASIALPANASRPQVRKKGMATMPHLDKHETLVKRHGTFSELPTTSIPDENAAPASTNSPLLSLQLSNEPDPIEDIPTYGDAIASTDAQGNVEEILFLRELDAWVGGLLCITNATRTALQIARQMPRGPSQTLEEWVYMSFGVSITDAMIPGFTREYLQVKWEMRDEAYEEHGEMADAGNRGVTGQNANSSDEDSDDE